MDQNQIPSPSPSSDPNFKAPVPGPPPWGNYNGPPVPPEPQYSRVEATARSYGSNIVFRRWAATMIDLVTFVGVLFTMLSFNNPNLAPVFIGFLLLYHLLLEGFTGFTVGKFIVRIQVVREDGRTPGLLKSLIRTLLRLVETNSVLFGAIPAGITALATKKKQRLGDIAANTYVLKVSDLKFKEPSRRAKITHTVIFSVIICLAVIPNVIALTVTGYPDSEPQSVVHRSEDGRFQMTDEAGLKRDSSTIKEIDANMALSDYLDRKGIVVFTYPKEEFDSDVTLEDFYFGMKEEGLDATSTVIQDRMVRINGDWAYELTYRGKVDRDEYIYIATVVDTSEHFHEVIGITEKRYYEEDGAKLRATIATFTETKDE
ncbi:hypothetical protein YSY43_18870 [Paenibacillus sp. YSY-4.3]